MTSILMLKIQDIINSDEIFPQPCPDRLFGKICCGEYKPLKSQGRQNIYYDKTETIPKNAVVAILESPHTSEYDRDGKPMGAANGKTGMMFDNKFEVLFSKSQIANSININGEFDVVLINAVQYQCSLGKQLNYCAKGKNDARKVSRSKCIENKLQRDANWLKCINNQECCDDFLMRLKALKPKLVLNLCTIGYSNLQLVLHDIICNNKNRFDYGDMEYTWGSHPSTWNFPYAQILDYNINPKAY